MPSQTSESEMQSMISDLNKHEPIMFNSIEDMVNIANSPEPHARMLARLKTVLTLSQCGDDQAIVGRIAAMMPDNAQPAGQHLHRVLEGHGHAGGHVLKQARIYFPRRLERITGGYLKTKRPLTVLPCITDKASREWSFGCDKRSRCGGLLLQCACCGFWFGFVYA